MTKYFHELTDEEYQKLSEEGKTWEEVVKLHPQPNWCNEPNALAGEMGCWSLVYRKGVNENYCRNCLMCNFNVYTK